MASVVRSDEFSSGAAKPSSLSDLDHTVLQIASRDGGIDRHANEIFEQHGLTTTRFAMHLNRLIDNPDANEQYPTTVNRWRRIREQRVNDRRLRSQRQAGDA